jgi:hypothetical protein
MKPHLVTSRWWTVMHFILTRRDKKVTSIITAIAIWGKVRRKDARSIVGKEVDVGCES